MKNHKEWVSQIFDRAAAEYGEKSSSFFSYFGKRLVEHANIHPGQHILDVATGRGAVLFPLAEAVGPSGKVIGIDISQQMINETSKEVVKKGFFSIELQCMDAEKLDFHDNYFDCIFCGFALFFLPSVSSALCEFKRVLKPGGILAVSTWGKDSKLDIFKKKELKKYCHTGSLIVTPLWDEKELHRVLEDAKLNNIQIFKENKLFLHRSAEEWWNSLWTHATRAKLEQLSTDQLASLRKQVFEKISHLNKGNGIPEDLEVFYGLAQKT